MARGDYIGFIDGDDYIENDMYEALINLANEYKTDISIVQFYNIENGKMLNQNYSNNITVMSNIEALRQVLLDDTITNHLYNKLFKKEVFNNIRFPIHKTFEDLATMYKILIISHKVAFLDTPKYYYVRRDDSITKNKTYDNYKDFIDILLERYNDLSKFFNSKKDLDFNAYGFINNIIWFYTVISTFKIPKLEIQFMEVYDFLKELISNHREIIEKYMSDYNKTILELMNNDSKDAREKVKNIYLNLN